MNVVPGPATLAAWGFVTVTLPLVFFEWTHRWEEDQPVSTALWWGVGAAPLLAATVAANWRRHGVGFRAAAAGAAVVSASFLAATLAVFRWVIPLTGAADWARVLLTGALLAVCGGVVGQLIGPRQSPRRAASEVAEAPPDGARAALAGRRGYLVGALVAVVGALLMQTTLRLGAEDSTVGPVPRASYGGLGPITPTDQGVLALPAAGSYAIYAVGRPPSNPDCRVGEATSDRVTIPPGDYGGDYATYAWIASFEVDAPGTYRLSCEPEDAGASYTVGDVPRIRGLVGSMIHWPLAVIWLLGAVPGLLVIADAARRSPRMPFRA